jgi:hypothetical protein
MPLLDHFHPPLSYRRAWTSVHGAWISAVVRRLNRELLPDDYVAEGTLSLTGGGEIDVGTLREPQASYEAAEAPPPAYRAPRPDLTVPGVLPDAAEVLVFRQAGGMVLVGAIELVSPGNKDRPETRRAFAAKLHALLQGGVAVVVVDPVTSLGANLHNEWVDVAQGEESWRLPPDVAHPLYAAAYRPCADGGQRRLEVWLRSFAVGEALPTLPLFLSAELAVPVELERTYVDACADLRLPAAGMAAPRY